MPRDYLVYAFTACIRNIDGIFKIIDTGDGMEANNRPRIQYWHSSNEIRQLMFIFQIKKENWDYLNWSIGKRYAYDLQKYTNISLVYVVRLQTDEDAK